ncbi:MAG: TIGR00266 family protein, partial [Ilumatobacteraceae bacterium]
MEVQTRQGPAYGVARLTLAPNEPVRVESGAMMAMSTGVVLQSKAEGGIMKSLKRAALGGESFFVSTYTAPASGGFVDIAARLPGDITTHAVTPGHALFVQKGSWLGNEVNVNIDAQWGGFKNLFGGEGGFIIRTEGQGIVVFACYGALEVWNLQAGQSITIDTGHMVAYEDTVQMQI